MNKTYTNPKIGIKISLDSIGNIVILRKKGLGGKPTIEIQETKDSKIKIRYNK